MFQDNHLIPTEGNNISFCIDSARGNTIEDSEGDGLMLFDDPLFPPEFDEEDDDC